MSRRSHADVLVDATLFAIFACALLFGCATCGCAAQAQECCGSPAPVRVASPAAKPKAAPQPVPKPQAAPSKLHPAVCRIDVADGGTNLSHGTGTLIAKRATTALVVTCWHTFRERQGCIHVWFPDGARYAAELIDVDKTFDLAALRVQGAPQADPVPLAHEPPRLGDRLWVAGYGNPLKADYQLAEGRCGKYYAPHPNLAAEVLSIVGVAPRNGDSGGPILNDRNELVAVLWGGAGGEANGSHVGRIRTFLTAAGVIDPPSQPIAQNEHITIYADPTMRDQLAVTQQRLAEVREQLAQAHRQHGAPAVILPPVNGPVVNVPTASKACDCAIDYERLADEVAKKLPGLRVVFEGDVVNADRIEQVRLGDTLRIPAVTIEKYDRGSHLRAREKYRMDTPLKLRYGAND